MLHPSQCGTSSVHRSSSPRRRWPFSLLQMGESGRTAWRESGQTRFLDEFVLGIEVAVEAAMRQPGGTHQLGESRRDNTALAELFRHQASHGLRVRTSRRSG